MLYIKKIKQIILIIISSICTILVAISFIPERLYANTLSKGFLIYAYDAESIIKGDKLANSVCVYDLNNDEEYIYSIDKYKNILSIGQNIGGDFCCIGVNQNGTNEILLFENGLIVYQLPISMELLQVAVYHDTIYFIGDGRLYSVEKDSNKYNLISKNLYNYNFSMNEKGEVAFVENIISENGENLGVELCIFSQNKKTSIETGESVECWFSNNEIITMAFLEEKDTFKNNKYIINIDTNECQKSDLFEDVYSVATISPNGKEMLYWSYLDDNLYTLNFLKEEKNEILLKDVDYFCMQKQFLWVLENPMG